jgi:selenocysteine lyase/cysteine desulfurase
MSSTERLIDTIRQSVIGEGEVLDGPFGPRRLTYADYTASGRSLSFIEDYLRSEVMPLYANTHTEASATGRQTTHLREQARRIIHRAVGGGPEDVVIFCGSGATGAIDKLVDVLNLRIPRDLDREHGLSRHIPPEQRPVVFIGPYEHHSNELAWRESIADVIVIPEDADGRICLDTLERALRDHQDRPLRIGSFSAASNVTGIGSKTAAIAALLHRYGALSFWDFAAAGPYVRIEMNLRGEGADADLAYKDAVFLSPHKFVGGPGTPGILVAKRHLFRNAVPAVPGGGTVAYVNATDHRYLTDPEHREEGGTPDILGSIRAGLVFQLKEAVGADVIRAREHDFVQRAIRAWSGNPRLHILGSKDLWRLSIVSFVVGHGQGFLHHNFVVALLSDLFGIQSRGGCSCAGPYGHRLLGIDLDQSQAYERESLKGCHGIKPGWVRVNFNYFIDEATFAFIVDAILWVAEHGHELLREYTFEPNSGLWRHRAGHPAPANSLEDIGYAGGTMEYPSRHATVPASRVGAYLGEADRVVAELRARGSAPCPGRPELTEDFESLRWFPLPHEGGPSAVPPCPPRLGRLPIRDGRGALASEPSG